MGSRRKTGGDCARLPAALIPSRRTVLAAGVSVPAARQGLWVPPLSAFDLWWAERERLEEALSAIAGDIEDCDAHLLTQAVAVENLIRDTRSSLRAAVRAKARVLTLTAEQSGDEWAPSLREIRDFIDRAT